MVETCTYTLEFSPPPKEEGLPWPSATSPYRERAGKEQPGPALSAHHHPPNPHQPSPSPALPPQLGTPQPPRGLQKTGKDVFPEALLANRAVFKTSGERCQHRSGPSVSHVAFSASVPFAPQITPLSLCFCFSLGLWSSSFLSKCSPYLLR